MKDFSISPLSMVRSLIQHRQLVASLIRREVIGRYRGSMLGTMWSFFNPLLMLIIYTFVFSVVFQARWKGGTGSKTEFAMVLFAGLLVFNIFSECLNRAPSLIVMNVNYVKKVVFPLEILPVVSQGAAVFHGLVSFLVWFVFYVSFFGLPPITAWLFPVVIMPLMFLVLGLGWFLASLGVYLRDVTQFVGLLVTALMFLSPIFYPVSSLPVQYRSLMELNPMTPVIEQVRGVLITGQVPDWRIFAMQFAASLLIAWLGFSWFQKTRKGFADVL
ncbi:ABC transporter permease [Luteibacter sp. ME-Dv--P-043b]|uniref:ABC transporter permease n=1 Tax=Luteibacter sp. ME-Dv--P-043b TaxID=3040291 RepID=UPI0025566E47|nr:ABC transporter permease [Luteibacter sp. ME-Dv--P-043b]